MKFNINVKINTKEFIPIRIVPRCGSFKKLKVLYSKDNLILYLPKCKEVNIPKKICLNSNDFMAIGLYISEGSTYCNLNNKTKHDGEISFANSTPECIIIFCNLLNKFQISTKNFKWKIGLNVNYTNTLLKEDLFNYWVHEIKLDKNNSRPKWIYYSGKIGRKVTTNTGKMGCLHIFYASTIFRSFFLNFIDKIFDDALRIKSKGKLALILKGFFAGDGCVNYSAKYKREQVEFLCNDLVLLNKIRKSLKILGLTSIRETWPESTKTHTKALRIYNKHDFKILENYDIPNLIGYKKEAFLKIINSLE